jgi:hypothetical protein
VLHVLRRSQEMAIDPDNWLRTLRLGFPDQTIPERGRQVAIRTGAVELDLTFMPLPPGRHGSLILPRARVDIRVSAPDEEMAWKVLAYLDLCFQRGGG